MNLSYTLRTSGLDALSQRGPRIRQAIELTALDIERTAKERCPVDTGALRASISHAMLSDTEGEVRVGQDYGAYVNYGTRFMAPRPFLTSAVEEARAPFVKRMREAVTG